MTNKRSMLNLPKPQRKKRRKKSVVGREHQPGKMILTNLNSLWNMRKSNPTFSGGFFDSSMMKTGPHTLHLKCGQQNYITFLLWEMKFI